MSTRKAKAEATAEEVVEKVEDNVEVIEENKPTVDTLVYCGPSLRNLQQNSVFSGELPEHVKQHTEKNKAVKELFVDVKDFSITQQRIKVKGSRENQLYLRALEYVKGETSK